MCPFEVSTLCPSSPLRQIRFQEVKQFHWIALQPLQLWCHQPKATLKNIPFECSQVNLDNLITGILDACQPAQWWSNRSRCYSIIDKFDLWYHIIYHALYPMVCWHWWGENARGGIIGCTSGAMRSRRRKGRVRSNILTLSPVMCLPVCLSTYMSMKWVAYAVLTSTILVEESRELSRSLRRVQTRPSIASDTSGLSGDLYSSGARRTCVYVYKDEGKTYSP